MSEGAWQQTFEELYPAITSTYYYQSMMSANVSVTSTFIQ